MTTPHDSPGVSQFQSPDPHAAPTVQGADLGFAIPPPARLTRTRAVALGATLVVVLAGAFLLRWLPSRHTRAGLEEETKSAGVALPRVQTVAPVVIASDRSLSLPGSMQPLEETILYPRANGFVKPGRSTSATRSTRAICSPRSTPPSSTSSSPRRAPSSPRRRPASTRPRPTPSSPATTWRATRSSCPPASCPSRPSTRPRRRPTSTRPASPSPSPPSRRSAPTCSSSPSSRRSGASSRPSRGPSPRAPSSAGCSSPPAPARPCTKSPRSTRCASSSRCRRTWRPACASASRQPSRFASSPAAPSPARSRAPPAPSTPPPAP